MSKKYSPTVLNLLGTSRDEATRLSCSHIESIHILLASLREKNVFISALLQEKGIDSKELKSKLENVSLQEHEAQNNNIEPSFDEHTHNLLKLSSLEARMQHSEIVDVEHILLAILHDSTENKAKEILKEVGIGYKSVVDFLKNRIPHENIITSNYKIPSNKQRLNIQDEANTLQTKTSVIDKFSIDLTAAAESGILDPVVGRDDEIQRVLEILCRRKKNNPILIGEPGVGKSAIVEGLAQLIANRRTSPLLFNKRILCLDVTSIVAGTKYRGQFEERLKNLIQELEANRNIIIFIDEIHTIIGAGNDAGAMDIANIMKPALARGGIQCIGATTISEYRKLVEKDGALERRFQRVVIEPSSEEETLQVLENVKKRYEEYHHVVYTDEAIKACVKLTAHYVADRQLPDKAIDAMDEVGAKVHLKNVVVPQYIIDKEKGFARLSAELDRNNGNRYEVTEKDVADVVSVMSGIPLQKISESESLLLMKLGNILKNKVIAQDTAIDKIVKSVQRNRLGLNDPNRPIGVFLFIGSTGVGKTYLAKCLAEAMFGTKDAIIRIDMSEYSEKISSSRLIGAPPGYVGYEEGGQLTEKVRQHPYSIILLDEIEKAHGDIFNLLLQVFDDGRLTDGNGRLIDFRNTIIIMTSNAGSRKLNDFSHYIGFSSNNNKNSYEYAQSVIKKSISQTFQPEFLNRIDEVVIFNQLDSNAIRKIIDKEISILSQRVANLGYKLTITESAKDFLAKKGYDKLLGARPIKRAIQDYLENMLCEKLLSGEVDKGEYIVIDKSENNENLTCK